MDLILHDPEESARDRAEGERLAYVAATRARDVLVVPVIGDDIYRGRLARSADACRSSASRRSSSGAQTAPGCPAFPSKDSVLSRPDGDPAKPHTVSPGRYDFDTPAITGEHGTSPPDRYSVVWWDPHQLILDAPPPVGLRRDDLISKDGDQAGVEARLTAYRSWQSERAAAVANAAVPSLDVRTATDVARHTPLLDQLDADLDVRVIDLSSGSPRPFGPRFGSLVHATLATVALDAPADAIAHVARTQGRILVCSDDEVAAAGHAVGTALQHPLFDRARGAAAVGRCHRELPVLWRSPEGPLIEGTIDLAFEDGPGTITVLDFKTDRELSEDLDQYRRQLAIYCRALTSLQRARAVGVIMKV